MKLQKFKFSEMKKILLVSILMLCVYGGFRMLASEKDNTDKVKREQVIHSTEYLYDQIDFTKCEEVLDRKVFMQAFYGFVNLKKEGKIAKNKHILSICDFSLSSNKKRLWVIDLKNRKVLFNTLVAHGQGTGEEYAVNFSNTPESHKSSLGFYITGNTYFGGNGYSLKLEGMDAGYNHNAMDRAIVIHGADYVSESFIQSNKRLGRSWGCPALPQATAKQTIDMIKHGNCLYVYYPDKKYLASSVWLKRVPSFIDQTEANPERKMMQAQAIPVSKPQITNAQSEHLSNNL